MKWNEYTNTCSDTPDFEERLDVSKMEITKIIIHSIGIDSIPIHKEITDIRKVYPQCLNI